jgi:DNA-directed RNA polymerase specialized sigma24 family protein
MSTTANAFRAAPLRHVADRCAEETTRFFHAQAVDASPCFELFRRAFAEKKQDGLDEENQPAWEAIIRVYGGLVAGWVTKHPETLRSNNEIQDYVNLAFARFWDAVRKAKFERFPDLRALLAYLKMCVHSAIVEDVRRASLLDRAVALDDLVDGVEGDVPASADSLTERLVLTREARSTFHEAVDARLQSEKERLVVYNLFELDLKPKAIYDLHPKVFADVHEIYRIRQVVLERLSRDPTLKRLAGEEP